MDISKLEDILINKQSSDKHSDDKHSEDKHSEDKHSEDKYSDDKHSEDKQYKIIDDLFHRQYEQLSMIKDQFSKITGDIENIGHIVKSCTGHVIITGVGKSGGIAKHTVSMLRSIGIKSTYLCPTKAMHGDMGTISKADILILYSKSGNTTELCNLLPYIPDLHMIGVFGKSGGKLEQWCNKIIYLPCGRELDNGINLVPTISVLSYMMFCNLLISWLIHIKNMTLESYGINHPAGDIGKYANLRVSDVLIPREKLCVVHKDISLRQVMIQMTYLHSSCALITDKDDKLIGILTDGDIRRYLTIDTDTKNILSIDIPVWDICGKSPSTINNINMRVCELSLELKLGQYPVLNDNNEILGLYKH